MTVVSISAMLVLQTLLYFSRQHLWLFKIHIIIGQETPSTLKAKNYRLISSGIHFEQKLKGR